MKRYKTIEPWRNYEEKNRLWLHYLVTFVVLSVITLLIAWWRGVFREITPKMLAVTHVNAKQYRLQQWSDSFFLCGIVAVFYGLIKALKRNELSALLKRWFAAIVRLFKEDSVDRKYRNIGNYQKVLREKKRRTHWHISIIGALFLGAAIGLLFAYFAAA